MKRVASGILPMVAVDRASSMPLHRQIYDGFRSAILEGRLRPGQRIPSTWIDQMICEVSLAPPPVAPLPLGTTDVPEMLELTAATEPGPFLPQTIQMGSYFGIRASDGRLVAMAGERLQSTACAEISALCTHPEFRGRGYARDLTTFLAAQILAAGKTPFLHVKSENGAKVVYQKIGFRLRAAICLTVISLR
jgi:N-acetylglutamate synthase-like GNAT family acetyltransferase